MPIDWKEGSGTLDSVQFNTSLSAPSHSEGLLYYDQTNKTLALYNEESDVTLQIGQETFVRVYNNSGVDIANGKPVYIDGSNGFPEIALAKADAEATADVAGFTTHSIENGTHGYVTINGIVRDVDTSAFVAGQSVYLSADTAGAVTATEPLSPNKVVHLGHAVAIDGSTGTIFVLLKEYTPDVEEILQIADGMAYGKPDFTVVDDSGLKLDIEKVGGGDMGFQINGTHAILDCTTGSGAGGKARVSLTAGADANNPTTNYIYVTQSAGVATLASSTSLPTGAFGWVGKIIVPDATTWATTGEYAIQRFTEAFSNDSRGALSHEREKLRMLGALYISGVSQTLNITANGGSADNVHLQTGSGAVYQLHRQTFPAFNTGPYYYGNGTSVYSQITDLNAALNQSDGTAITNNQRFNLVIWGAVNYSSGDCKLYVNLPNGVYASDSQAEADSDNTADYSVPDDMKSVAFLISRVALKYTTLSSGTWTELGTYSLLGTPVGSRQGGAGAVASNEFDDSQLRVYDNGDVSKQIALEASNITTATTRTITMADVDVDLASNWRSLVIDTDFNDDPPSTSTITMNTDQTANIKVGTPIRFTLGGSASNPGTYYAVCTAITSNLLTIAGAPLEIDDGDLTALAYDPVRTPQQIDLFVSGTYGDGTDTTLLASDMNTYFEWQGKKSYLVFFSCIHKTVDTGTEPKINVRINSADVSTNDSNNGVQLGATATWVDNSAVAINTSNYDINRGESMELNCTAAGGTGDASDLTVSCLFVEE